MMLSHDELGDLDQYEKVLERRRRRNRIVWIGLAVIGIALLVAWRSHGVIWGVMKGESNLWGERAFAAKHLGALEKIDVDQVHREFLPSWVIAAANKDLRGGKELEATRWNALEEAISADKNLLELAVEMRQIVRDGDVVESVERLSYLMWAWTKYLDENGSRYVVQSNVAVTAANRFFYVKVYERLDDVQVGLADDVYRTRIVRRVDRTNVREQYLGATSKGADGAIVVVDRVLEFATDRIWPAFEPSLDERLDPKTRPWAPVIREEARSHLGAEIFEILRETAEARLDIVEAIEAIHARHECGSSFVISEVPFDGLSDRSLQTVERFAGKAGEAPCPDIKPDEARLLRAATETLRDSEDLEAAVQKLVFWLSRSVAVHEARHVADDRLENGLEEPLDCSACPEDMPAVVRAELSSYLASFAWAKSPQTAFFQACDATQDGHGAHAMAMQMILDGLGTTCDRGSVEGLAEKARRFEEEWLGRSNAIVVPELGVD